MSALARWTAVTAVTAVLVLVVTFGAVAAPASGAHVGDGGETSVGEENNGGGHGGVSHADEGDDSEDGEGGSSDSEDGERNNSDGRDGEGDSSDRRSERGNGSEGKGDGRGDGSADDGNSSIAVELDVGPENPGGDGGFACTGTPQRHECDKGGDLAAGPLTVDYEGYNYADAPGMNGGGGDEFTVAAENRTATAGFDCDLRRETLADGPCAVDGNSSEGDLPAAP